MKHYIFFLSVIFVCFLRTNSIAQNGKQVYMTYCAGCHGNNLKGNHPLIKDQWINGKSLNSIIQSITKGVENTQMIAFSNTLKKNEIAAIAKFIMDNQQLEKISKKNKKVDFVQTKDYRLKVETLVDKGIGETWGIEFVNNQTALISEKAGTLRWLIGDQIDPRPITGTPFTFASTIYGGYMDIALDPQYDKNGWVYLAFSYNPAKSSDVKTPGMTKIVRGKIKGYQWTNEENLFEVADSVLVSMGMRWGSRLLFDKEGYLYFTIGDMQQVIQSGNNPQLPYRPEGKIFRIHPDGRIPKDNPFAGQQNVLPQIYAWGTRNVQGIAMNKTNGKIYFSDHGPKGGDEINLLKKGGNYGWPLVTYGVNYNDSPISKDTALQGLVQPITYYVPSIAVCGLEIIQQNNMAFPAWHENLLLTALKDQELRRISLKDDKVIEQEILLKNRGRVRDVKIAPNGSIYVLTNAPDAVLRITKVIK